MRTRIISVALTIITGTTASGACPPLSLLDRPLPAATLNTPYAATLPTLGGNAPLAILLTEGLLPPGITIDAAGALHGTPRSTGNYRFTVFASDSCTPVRQQASRPYLLAVVNPGEVAQVPSAKSLPALAVKIDSLPPVLTIPASTPNVTLRYRLTASPAASAILESPGNSFVVDGGVVAVTPTPLSAVLINGVADMTEEVTIPPVAIRAALNGSGTIIINRAFSGRGTTAVAIIEVRLKR